MRHPIGIFLAVALIATPALAQRRGASSGGGGFSRGGGARVGGGGGGARVGGGVARSGGGFGNRSRIGVGGGGGYRIGGGYSNTGRGSIYSGSRSYSYGRGGIQGSFGYGPSWYRYPVNRNPYLFRAYRSSSYYPYFYSSFSLSPYYYNNWYWQPALSTYYSSPAYVGTYSVAPSPPYTAPPATGGRDQFGQLREPASGEPVTYLLAFSNGTVETCVAYWVEGATLHYVTRDHALREVPLASLDRGESERLNQQRQVTFRLPR